MLRIKALVVVYNVDDHRNRFSPVYDVAEYRNTISLVAVHNVDDHRNRFSPVYNVEDYSSCSLQY
jgi:hypothetical protein